MSMTEEQFEDYINSEAGESHFYEYLYDNYPTGNDEKIIWMIESGNYVEEFMDHLGVIYNEA